MGVWCDPVRNQFGENGCDYDLRTGWPGNKRVSLDCSGDENAIATAIQRWLISCLDFGLLMGVAITKARRKNARLLAFLRSPRSKIARRWKDEFRVLFSFALS